MNADQQWLPHWREQAGRARQVTFGLSEAADYRAVQILHKGIKGTEFLLRGTGGIGSRKTEARR